MKLRTAIALVTPLTAALAAPAALRAQGDSDVIARAVLAAPENARAQATVVAWRQDGARTVLRQGTNGLVCWDQAAWPHQQPFSVRCTDEANLPRVEQNLQFYRKAASAKEAEQMIAEAEKAGTRPVPKYGSAYYSLVGKDQASARPHVTISVPFATSETLKLPSKPTASSGWIMQAGTSAAHIMVPGR